MIFKYGRNYIPLPTDSKEALKLATENLNLFIRKIRLHEFWKDKLDDGKWKPPNPEFNPPKAENPNVETFIWELGVRYDTLILEPLRKTIPEEIKSLSKIHTKITNAIKTLNELKGERVVLRSDKAKTPIMMNMRDYDVNMVTQH